MPESSRDLLQQSGDAQHGPRRQRFSYRRRNPRNASAAAPIPKAWLYCRIAAIHLLLFVTVWFASIVAAEEQSPTDSPPQSPKFGTPQVLTENLIRVREMEGLLRTVEISPGGAFSPSAIEALQKVFEYPADVFSTDPQTWRSSSIRAEAIRMLRQAPPATQRQWVKATELLAEARLQMAIRIGGRDRLNQVARQFPMTQPGINAAILVMTMDLLEGRKYEVRLRLTQLDAELSGTVHESFFQRNSRNLRARLSASNAPQPGATPTREPQLKPTETRLSLSTPAEKGSVAPPWPKAKWSWSESVGSVVGAPMPQAAALMESLFPNTENSLNDFSNWKPVFWGNTIVHRSPFRLVGFDRLTGREQWSLTTQTFTPAGSAAPKPEGEPDELNQSFGRIADEPLFLTGLAAYGLLSCDDDFLYFVDRFDFFRNNADDINSGNSRQVFNQFGILRPSEREFSEGKFATRVVALRRNAAAGLPTLAWIAGEQSGFTYQAVNSTGASPEPLRAMDVTALDTVSPADESSDSGEPFRPAPTLTDHRFLGPPIGRGEQLFLLSIQNEIMWLNCLTRGTGRVEWQQPLVFADDWTHRLQEFSNPVNGTSISLLSGETVVCSLSSGVLIGVRAADGQLQWATAVREEAQPRQLRGFRFGPDQDMEDDPIESPCVIVPVATDGVVVSADSQSRNLYGVDTSNGEILWMVARRAFGPGDVGGSPDYYIAEISGSQIILIGERHCRSLELKTGDQNWVVPIGPMLGRAECRGDRCLIPLTDGRIVTIDLKEGTVLRLRPAFLPEDSVPQFGAITTDKDLLCASTPVSLTVFPRADAFLNDAKASPAAADKNGDAILQAVQAHLILGTDDKAIEILTGAISDAPDDSTARFERYLGELILQDWGLQIISSDGVKAGTQAPLLIGSEQTQLLPQLNLTSAQQLRAAVLAVLSRPDVAISAEDFSELTRFPDWRTPITITEDWSIRPDVLLNHAADETGSESLDFTGYSITQLKRVAEDAILFPGLLKTDAHRRRLVNQLISKGNYAAAEAVATIWKNVSDANEPDEILVQLRERDVIAGYPEADVRQRFHPEDLPDSSTPESGLTSGTKTALTIDSQIHLGLPDWDLQRVEKGLAISSLPDWMSLRCFLVDGDGFPDFVSMDMKDGSLRDRVTLPFAPHRNIVSFRPLSNGRSTPGLLPFAGSDQLTMISCTVPDEARILWTRRFRKRGSEDTAIEFGPLGADYFIWHHDDELHCSHPLTGRDLWVRKMRLSPVKRPMAGVRRIFGDEKVIVIMGTDLTSMERFSTRDGRPLGSGRLEISRVSEAVCVGRCILYPDNNSRLHMYDGAADRDMLEKQDPVLVGPHNFDSMFDVLPEGRVVTVSAGLEVILLDTTTGQIVFRTPARSIVKTGNVFGFTAFERYDKLFVGIEEQRDFVIRSVEAAYRPHEPRVNAGPLLCMNPRTGEIEWSRPLLSATIPPVYGDPTDLMLIWSMPPSDVPLAEQKKGQTIDIELLNSSTGEELLKETSLSTSRPVRSVHDAAKKSIEVVSKDSMITIHAESDPGGVQQE